MKTINVAIADDHALFRMGLAALLGDEPDIDVVLEAGNGEDLLNRINGIPADVILMDVEMPGMGGLEATLKMREKHPDMRVVMLSAHNDPSTVLLAIENGARGYLLKHSRPEEVIDAVRTVMQNGFCFNQDISLMLLRGISQKEKFQSHFNPVVQLTDRELEVLRLICKELTNTEIGEKLFLSPRTVESHRKNIMEKVGARNMVGLVLYALKNKLVDPDV